jgi:chromosome segregation ATPase
LRNYRIAHAQAAAIEPFEAVLREHTSLTSIVDPSALVEFLSQKDLQKDMAMEELKRIDAQCRSAAKERDELRSQLDEAQRKTRGSSRNADIARGSDDPLGVNSTEAVAASPKQKSTVDDDFFSYDTELSLAEADDAESSSKVAQLETMIAEQRVTIDRLQALDNEQRERIEQLESQTASDATRLQQSQTDSQEHKEFINELSTENASLRQDLDITRLDLSAMNNKIHLKDNSIKEIELQLKQTKELLEEASKKQDTTRDAQRQEQLAPALNDPDVFQDDQKRLETLDKVVNSLREQVKSTENARKATDAEAQDLRFKIRLMEAESDSAGKIISSLRSHEEVAKGLKRRLGELEMERDDAQRLASSKTGHEAAAASLRVQLKRIEKDRDAAYQMILDCGKCSIPDSDKNAEGANAESSTSGSAATINSGSGSRGDVDTEPAGTTSSTLIDDDASASTEGKKKNKKKKSKAKKKSSEETAEDPVEFPTLDELIHDPAQGNAIMLRTKHAENPMLPLLMSTVEKMKAMNEIKDDERDERYTHLEDLVETRDQIIKDFEVIIQSKNEEIMSLRQSLEDSPSGDKVAGTDVQIEALHQEIKILREKTAHKDTEIEKLNSRLAGEASLHEEIENLSEENETLRDSMIDHGKQATDALHDLKIAKDNIAKLRNELEAVQRDNRVDREKLEEALADKLNMISEREKLEAEVTEIKTKSAPESELKDLREKLGQVTGERDALESAKSTFESQIAGMKAQHNASDAEGDAKSKALSADLSNFKSKAFELEKELAAANQLAQTRYKDLAELKTAYNKMQPELKKLREEAADLKQIRADLDKATASVKRLEAKEKDLRSEIAEYKSQLASKDAELTSWKEKTKRSEERSTVLEESYETARKDLVASESTRDEAVEIREKLQTDLRKLEDQLDKSRSTIRDLEKQVQKHADDANALREEMSMKAAQQASAQSLMDSMRDQTNELSTQMKEVREQKESMEEELIDANRLLSERSREAETMRRLLADVEGRAESKVKEMRERMDLALEERDRAEDEASSIGKRRTRELEDYKLRLHDAEREASRAADAKQDAERRARDLLDRETELQRRASQAQTELTEVRTAMAQLRDALDETERQSRQLEKEKSEARKSLEDKEMRLERLQKSSKAMAEELRALQQQHSHQGIGSPGSLGTAKFKSSPRPSVDSTRVASPAGTASGSKDGVDYVYLKNILLQFLEQKEKKHQMQLVPVLGMLLHFDRAEEQKWMAAISANK